MELQSGTKLVANVGFQSTSLLYTSSQDVKLHATKLVIQRGWHRAFLNETIYTIINYST